MRDRPRHTLVVYRESRSADRLLRELADSAGEAGGRLTVLAIAVEEPTGRGCCDTRSVLWNRYQREFAHSDLDRARVVAAHAAEAEFAVLAYRGRHVADAIAEEARLRGADEVVLADPSSSRLTRRERRRLRAVAAVPVAA